MTLEQWRQMTPGQQAQHVARYGPPPPGWSAPTAAESTGLAVAPRRRRRWPWIACGIVAFLFLLGIVAAGNRTSSSAPSASYGTTPTRSAAAAQESPAAAQAPAAPAPAAAPAVAPGPVGDGTYQVGTDIAAGRYKTAGPDGNGPLDICYWARLKDDSGTFDAIISNNLVKGPGSVSLRKGEFIEFTGGCQWTKQ